MMELELCLIFSGAGGLLAGVSCCAGEEDKAGGEMGSVGSGENSEVGEVRLLARPVERSLIPPNGLSASFPPSPLAAISVLGMTDALFSCLTLISSTTSS